MSAASVVSLVGARLVTVRRRRVKKRFNAHLIASRLDRPPGLTPRQVTQHVLQLDDGQQVGAATMARTFADGTAMPRSAAACFDPDALVLRWTAFPPRPLPPRPGETMLDWRIEELSGTGRRGSATAAGRAADWAAGSRR